MRSLIEVRLHAHLRLHPPAYPCRYVCLQVRGASLDLGHLLEAGQLLASPPGLSSGVSRGGGPLGPGSGPLGPGSGSTQPRLGRGRATSLSGPQYVVQTTHYPPVPTRPPTVPTSHHPTPSPITEASRSLARHVGLPRCWAVLLLFVVVLPLRLWLRCASAPTHPPPTSLLLLPAPVM